VAQGERLGRALSDATSPDGAADLSDLIPSRPFAEAVEQLLAAWKESPAASGQCVGAAVASGAHAGALSRRAEDLELVVSGPKSVHLHPRSTEQVLLELIGEAQHEILIVTYALQGYAELEGALAQAAARGVRITVVAETSEDSPGFQGDPARALGTIPVERLRWPRDQRPARGAALHAKVVVVDRSTVLITSANLTQRASADNLEVGVLLRGDDAGERIVNHVSELTATGVLRRA